MGKKAAPLVLSQPRPTPPSLGGQPTPLGAHGRLAAVSENTNIGSLLRCPEVGVDGSDRATFRARQIDFWKVEELLLARGPIDHAAFASPHRRDGSPAARSRPYGDCALAWPRIDRDDADLPPRRHAAEGTRPRSRRSIRRHTSTVPALGRSARLPPESVTMPTLTSPRIRDLTRFEARGNPTRHRPGRGIVWWNAKFARRSWAVRITTGASRSGHRGGGALLLADRDGPATRGGSCRVFATSRHFHAWHGHAAHGG